MRHRTSLVPFADPAYRDQDVAFLCGVACGAMFQYGLAWMLVTCVLTVIVRTIYEEMK